MNKILVVGLLVVVVYLLVQLEEDKLLTELALERQKEPIEEWSM